MNGPVTNRHGLLDVVLHCLEAFLDQSHNRLLVDQNQLITAVII